VGGQEKDWQPCLEWRPGTTVTTLSMLKSMNLNENGKQLLLKVKQLLLT